MTASNTKHVSTPGVPLLRYGRHFRVCKNQSITGRNQKENKFLVAHKAASGFYFELPVLMGPNTLLQGPQTNKAVKVAEFTAFQSDAKERSFEV